MYIISHLSNGEVVETKLMKLLYLSEADYFEKYNSRIISNVRYYKNHFGPTPDYKVLSETWGFLKDFIKKEELKRGERKMSLYKVIDKEYGYTELSVKEIEVVNSVLNKYGLLSSEELSKLSHSDPPYLAASENSAIDFKLVMQRKNEEDFEKTLTEKEQKKIASDITTVNLKKLFEYAREHAA